MQDGKDFTFSSCFLCPLSFALSLVEGAKKQKTFSCHVNVWIMLWMRVSTILYFSYSKQKSTESIEEKHGRIVCYTECKNMTLQGCSHTSCSLLKSHGHHSARNPQLKFKYPTPTSIVPTLAATTVPIPTP